MSEAERIPMTQEKGPLPPGWRWVRLGEMIIEAIPGFASGERDPAGAIQVRMGNVDTLGNLQWDGITRVPASSAQMEKYSLSPGDVLFNNTNSTDLVGKSACFMGYSETVLFSNHFTRIRTNVNRLLPEFLSRWLVLQWHERVFANLCNRWIGQSAVQLNALLGLVIALPEITDQRRITAIIHAQLAAAERTRLIMQGQVDAARGLTSAYINQIIPNAGQELPSGWRWARLGDVCEFLDSRRIPVNDVERKKRIAGKSLNNLFPYYGANGQVGWIDDYLFDESLVLLAEDGGFFGSHDRAIAYKIAGKAWVNNHAHVLRPKGSILIDYLHHTLSIRPDIGRMVTGNTRPKLNQEIASRVPIPLPSLDEQQKVVTIMNLQKSGASRLSEKLKSQLSELDALPVALLRKAFSGEL